MLACVTTSRHHKTITTMGFMVDAAVFTATQLVFAMGGVVFLRLGLFTSIEMNQPIVQVESPPRPHLPC